MPKPKLSLITGSGRMPSERDLLGIRLAATGEYELSDAETKRARQLIYSLNKNNVTYRWRTLREGPYFMVWKLRK